eukprot:8720931-Ditylum_brightwellii.AAC.1
MIGDSGDFMGRIQDDGRMRSSTATLDAHIMRFLYAKNTSLSTTHLAQQLNLSMAHLLSLDPSAV